MLHARLSGISPGRTCRSSCANCSDFWRGPPSRVLVSGRFINGVEATSSSSESMGSPEAPEVSHPGPRLRLPRGCRIRQPWAGGPHSPTAMMCVRVIRKCNRNGGLAARKANSRMCMRAQQDRAVLQRTALWCWRFFRLRTGSGRDRLGQLCEGRPSGAGGSFRLHTGSKRARLGQLLCEGRLHRPKCYGSLPVPCLG
jgi:hypothetical protein